MKYSIVIPTYNGGSLWSKCIESILIQSLLPQKVVIIDSSSEDSTTKLAIDAGFEVHVIDKIDFDHGGTRTMALKYIESEVVIFLTQDCILASQNTIRDLLFGFSDISIGAIYGRQLPHYNANPLAKYAREHNYSGSSYITSLHDTNKKGFKKVFLSNSFSAYRLNNLNSIGGFPDKLILGEDSYVAAKMLLDGKKVAYQATSSVFHSHNYSLIEEFRRYFDIGVFHRSQSWIIDSFGTVEGEGLKFAINQILTLWKDRKYSWLFFSCMHSFVKYIGYKLGWHHNKLNRSVCTYFSMFKSYWN